MQPLTLLLALALVAGIHARDDWSWGSDGTGDSPLSESRSANSGRSMTFPSSSRDDHNAASSLLTEVVQPSIQTAPAFQTARSPRLIQAANTFPGSRAVPTFPTAQAGHNAPATQSFQAGHNAPATQSFQAGHNAPATQSFQAGHNAPATQSFQAGHNAPATQSFQAAPLITSAAPQLIGNNLVGENRDDKPHGDGQSEGRFLGLKDKLCDVGIGFDCKKGYDSHGHHGGNGLSVYDVSYVQPIQVVPVGGPIAAVPVNKGHKKGHHHKAPAYHPPQPAYHPPQPAYHPPQPAYHPPQPAYRPPQPTYSAPRPTYGAPAPVYNPPKPAYSPPASSYATPSHSSYTPPKASYGQGAPATVVKHVHTHHHVYNGPSSQGGYSSFGKDNSFGSSTSSLSGTNSHFNTFSSSIKKVGSVLPAIPPRQQFLTPTTQRPAYLEECQCVERRYCSSFDVVGRSNNLRPFLDARTRTTDILSTADDEGDFASISNGNDLAFSASETHSVVEEATDDLGTHKEAKDAERKKRDTLSIAVADIGVGPAANPTSRQARQFQFSGYSPGLSGCAASHVCCRSPVFRSSRDVGSCGRRSSVGLLGRVKNTRFETGDTEFGEYPWQAAILKKEGGDNVYVCGAVLIDARHLLTAAHCINGINPSELKVRLGEWDVASETEFYRYIESPVSGVYSHPEFYSGNLNNDIAIMRLFSPVDLVTNPHISPICLPDRFAVFTGQRCHVTGWGKNAFGDTGDFQHLLKEVDIPVVDHTICQSALRHTRLGSQYVLHQGMVCAGGEEGKDACEGDGGSPLVCRGQDGTMMLTGLVSWGVGCGRRGVPGVYTNIPHYLTWIRSITST